MEELDEVFETMLDESRRRRKAGEPSNVQVSAWELVDGERIEIKHTKEKD